MSGLLAALPLPLWLLVPAVAVAALLILWPNTVPFAKIRRDIPLADGGLPIVGHLLTIRKNVGRRLERVVELAEKYGEAVRQTVYFPGFGIMDTVLLTNPTDVEYIYRDPWKFIKGEMTSARIHDFAGHGIFTQDGDGWKLQRKTASNIFNLRNFRDVFGPVFLHDARDIVRHLGQACDAGLVVDLQELLLRSTADSFVKLAMGKDIGALNVPYTAGRAVDARGNPYGVYNLPPVAFADAYDVCTHLLAVRATDPFWETAELRDGRRKKMQDAVATIDSFVYQLIAEKRARGAKPGREGDILDLFMGLRDDDGKEFDDKYLRDVVVNFILAGRDTTAQTLSWTLWELAQHRDIEQRLREEILEAVGKDGEITYEACKDLKLCTAVFNETLRIHANVPVQQRYVVEDCVMPGTGTRIYAGQVVQVSSYAMGHLERIWLVCRQFKPDRWFDEKGNLIKENQFKWPVFNAGPRICLGMNMATQEALVFLAAILRDFTLDVVHEDKASKYAIPETKEGRYIVGVTLGIRDGLEVVPKRV
ncbi:cytochrome P450 [Hyaloraphidium curvatum]|nr:cytochrome P450 [Hyaloraphidium curvatum]